MEGARKNETLVKVVKNGKCCTYSETADKMKCCTYSEMVEAVKKKKISRNFDRIKS